MGILKEHLSKCLHCRESRSLFLHDPISEGKSTWLRCVYCSFCSESPSGNCILYPCGGWDFLSPDSCECAYFDRLGNVLKIDERLVMIPIKQPFSLHFSEADMFLMQRVKDIRLEDFYIRDHVEFRGIEDGRSDKQYYGYANISNVLAVRAFRKLYVLARSFVAHTLPKLHALRCKESIAKFLHWSEMQRLCRANRVINRIILQEACNNIALARQLWLGDVQNGKGLAE